MNHLKIPFLLPFKFVPNTSSPGVHLDDSWACEQIRDFERKVYYRQKWNKADTTPLQIESSIAPEDLKVYNQQRVVVKSLPWQSIFSYLSYGIYEVTVDLSDLPNGVYYLYQRVNLLSVDWKAVSEPIETKEKWLNTELINYKHSFNDYDVAFSTGISFNFRCEAGIMDMEPQRNATEYTNQSRNVVLLSAVPSRVFKLLVGTAPGVPIYIVDILNRIFDCDTVSISGKRFAANPGSEWKLTRVRGYPLVGAELEIVEAENLSSLNFADTNPLAPGIVTAYNIETTFFGQGAIVPITEVEEH